MLRRLLPLLIIILVIAPTFGYSLREHYVYDGAGVLTRAETADIESMCTAIDNATSAEVVIVTLNNLARYGGDINKAKVTIFNDESLDGVKGIGKSGKDNGVLIVVSMEERKWGIEIGYGLEENLTDVKSGIIGRNILVPSFESGDYFTGLYNATASIAGTMGLSVEGYQPIPLVEQQPSIIDVILRGSWIMFFLGSPLGIFVLVIILLVAFLFGRGRFSGGGGRSGGGGASGNW